MDTPAAAPNQLVSGLETGKDTYFPIALPHAGKLEKLRANLLLKYPPVAGGGPPLLLSARQAAIDPPVSASVSPSPASTSHPERRVGIIEVLSSHTVALGYLTFDPTSGIDITPDKEKAVIVSFPPGKGSDVLHLDMPNATRRIFSYLGLSLLVPEGRSQNVVPDMLPGVSIILKPYSQHGIPEASARCKHSTVPDSDRGHHYYTVAFATWTFLACGESNKAPPYRRRSQTDVLGTRAAAAVWKYEEEELKLYWLMDDGTECELGGYVHSDTSDQLHVHRISDMDKTGYYIREDRVVRPS
ncbi:hypothetical protein FS837_001791 [Tulasnella sp. UAMH 9824]|nr:hypothetical protein FS837_001791 [Tulasnella sp. UAMH 9824]